MRRPPRDQLISGAGFPLARHTRLNTVLSRTLTLRGASVILAASEITSQQLGFRIATNPTILTFGRLLGDK